MKTIKISDKLHELLVSLAEKKSRALGVEYSISQLLEEIVNVYVSGVRDGKALARVSEPREIENHYDNVYCDKCKKKIEINEMCVWIKYEYTDKTSRSVWYCLDCWYSSSALAKQYLNKKKLELVVKGLRQEADKLVAEINRLTQELEQLKIDLDTRKALLKIREELEFLLTMQLISREDYFKMLNKIEELLLRVEELEKRTRPLRVEEKRVEEKQLKQRYK